MPKIHVQIEYSISQVIALERVKGLLNKLRDEYGNMISDLKEKWDGNVGTFSFRAMGMSVEGEIHVEPGLVIFDGKIPITALAFKGTIEKTIIAEANKLLN
jgi:hypothetical protein